MAKDAAMDAAKDSGDEGQFEVSPEVIQMANSCFATGDEAARRGNCDYAITMYLEGLRYVPDDVEHGHKPLLEAARRLAATGKAGAWGAKAAQMKASMLQTMGKKKEAFAEMEKALVGNADNSVSLANMAQMAANLGLKNTSIFFAEQALEAARRLNKTTEAMCVQMANIYERNGKYREAMQALQDAEKLDKSQSNKYAKHIRDLAARTSIGDTEQAKSYRDRVKSKDQAVDSAKQKVVTAQDELAARADEMVKQLEKTPNDLNLLVTIGDTYARAERDEEAMQYYRKARTLSGGADYRIKVKMDDLRIRQFRQELRRADEALAKNPNDESLKAQRRDLIQRRNQFELEVFKERADEYPTDMGVRYDLGLRYYRCGQIEEALSAFQLSTRDPKRKILSLNMLGKCFFQSRLYPEAAGQFQRAIEGYEVQGDEMWKELRYNLGLTYETMKEWDKAKDCYSEIVMVDFQYKDAAKRLSRLRNRKEGSDEGGETIVMSESE